MFRVFRVQAKIQACFYHFTQSILRKVGTIGLITQYKNREAPQPHQFVRRLVSLAFLPVEDVKTGMEHRWQLSTTLPRDLHEKVNLLLGYFDSTYVNGPIRRGRRAGDPMYDLDVWNVHKATLEHRDRTNNNSETFNAAFKLSVRCSNPGLWLVIDTLQTTFRSIERASFCST